MTPLFKSPRAALMDGIAVFAAVPLMIGFCFLVKAMFS